MYLEEQRKAAKFSVMFVVVGQSVQQEPPEYMLQDFVL